MRTSKESIFKPTNAMIQAAPDSRPKASETSRVVDENQRQASTTLTIAGVLGFISTILTALFSLLVYTVAGATALSPNSSLPPVGSYALLVIALPTAALIAMGVVALYRGQFRTAFRLGIAACGVAALPLVLSLLAVVALFVMTRPIGG